MQAVPLYNSASSATTELVTLRRGVQKSNMGFNMLESSENPEFYLLNELFTILSS
jgi:hypothetical protein